MANSITGVNDLIIAQAGLQAFTARTTPLSAFARNFSSDAARPGDTIKVFRETYPDAVPLSKTSHGEYTIQDADSDAAEITLGQPDYVSWGLDDVEIASSSVVNMNRYGNGKGNMLAKTVLGNIWGDITAANYGAAGFTGAENTFSIDGVIALGEALDNNDAPDEGRALVITPAMWSALLSELGANYNAGNEPLREGAVGRVSGFDVYKSTLIPNNGENLVGFACVADAMAVAMRYLMPQEGHNYTIAQPLADDPSGITLGLRDWYKEESGVRARVLECVYGHTVGIAAGLVRCVTA